MSTFKNKIININSLAKVAGVSSSKLYERKHQRVKAEMTLLERTMLLNTLTEHTIAFAKDLGFTIEVTLAHPKSPKKRKERSLA